MRLLLLVNASASSVTTRARVYIQETLATEHEVTVAETSRRGHATRLAQGAAADGMDAVVVLGGDGTLNEAANGLAGSSTALGVLPGGSTNVFARTIGTASEPVAGAGQLLVALARRSIRRIGLGRANGRYFLFHAGIGFDAAVVEQVERRGSLKRFAGHPLFLYAAFDTWFRHYDHNHPHFDIHVGPSRRGQPAEVMKDAYFAICLKTNPYTFLGNRPLDVAPEANFDTGLSVVALQTLAAFPLLRVIVATMRGRGGEQLARRPSVTYASNVDEATVTGARPFPYQVDGDYLGLVERLELSYQPDALDLILPR